MKYLLLNPAFETTAVVEAYDSLIWTERYNKSGDFEIYLGASVEAFSAYKEDYYLWSDSSDRLMILEDIELETDDEGGKSFLVTGRSLESILTRRIVWSFTNLTGNLQNGIQQLLNQNVISPTDTTRRIPNFVFIPSTDPKITSLTIDEQFLGENLYDVIVALCALHGIGFKVTLNATNQFEFRLYAGLDRTFDQVANPRVIFSPDFDNLGSSRYVRSKRLFATETMIAGEGQGAERFRTSVSYPGGAQTGLIRREIFTDASGVSSRLEGGATMSTADYQNLLLQKGRENLSDHGIVDAFDGEIEPSPNFVYREDYNLGDIVQLGNEYGLEGTSRVTEFIRAITPEGTKAYPTLEAI